MRLFRTHAGDGDLVYVESLYARDHLGCSPLRSVRKDGTSLLRPLDVNRAREEWRRAVAIYPRDKQPRMDSSAGVSNTMDPCAAVPCHRARDRHSRRIV